MNFLLFLSSQYDIYTLYTQLTENAILQTWTSTFFLRHIRIKVTVPWMKIHKFIYKKKLVKKLVVLWYCLDNILNKKSQGLNSPSSIVVTINLSQKKKKNKSKNKKERKKKLYIWCSCRARLWSVFVLIKFMDYTPQ